MDESAGNFEISTKLEIHLPVTHAHAIHSLFIHTLAMHSPSTHHLLTTCPRTCYLLVVSPPHNRDLLVSPHTLTIHSLPPPLPHALTIHWLAPHAFQIHSLVTHVLTIHSSAQKSEIKYTTRKLAETDKNVHENTVGMCVKIATDTDRQNKILNKSACR